MLSGRVIKTALFIVLFCSSVLVHGDPLAFKTTLVVVGVMKEAKAARGQGVSVVISGASSSQLRNLLASQDIQNLRAIISFGVAGGLNSAYQPGDVIVPSEVLTAEDRWHSDEVLRAGIVAALSARGVPVRQGALYGSEEVILTAERKSDLRAQSNADAVDMESHVAAEFAARHGIPFAVLRVISDPAHRALPMAAASAVLPSGRVNILSIVWNLVKSPAQLRDLFHAGRDARRAFGVLRDCQALLVRQAIPTHILLPAE